MTEEMEIFAAFLKSRDLRLTAVRRELIRFVERTDGVFDESAVRTSVFVENVPLNRASVYRNLALLKEAGLIEECPVKLNGKTGFQAKRPHGRIYDIICPGCHAHRNVFHQQLDDAILDICREYHLNPDGIQVRIEARHLRGKHD